MAICLPTGSRAVGPLHDPSSQPRQARQPKDGAAKGLCPPSLISPEKLNSGMGSSPHPPVVLPVRPRAQPSGKCSSKTAATLSLEEGVVLHFPRCLQGGLRGPGCTARSKNFKDPGSREHVNHCVCPLKTSGRQGFRSIPYREPLLRPRGTL